MCLTAFTKWRWLPTHMSLPLYRVDDDAYYTDGNTFYLTDYPPIYGGSTTGGTPQTTSAYGQLNALLDLPVRCSNLAAGLLEPSTRSHRFLPSPLLIRRPLVAPCTGQRTTPSPTYRASSWSPRS